MHNILFLLIKKINSFFNIKTYLADEENVKIAKIKATFQPSLKRKLKKILPKDISLLLLTVLMVVLNPVVTLPVEIQEKY